MMPLVSCCADGSAAVLVHTNGNEERCKSKMQNAPQWSHQWGYLAKTRQCGVSSIPVCRLACTDSSQHVWLHHHAADGLLLRKKAEKIKKVKLWERKHWCLTYPRSVRISQWYLTPGLNAVGAHLMLRLTNWKSPIHIKLSLQATYIPPSTPFISLLMTISEINQLKLTSTMTFSEFPSGNLLKEHSHSYPEHFLRRRYFGDF